MAELPNLVTVDQNSGRGLLRLLAEVADSPGAARVFVCRNTTGLSTGTFVPAVCGAFVLACALIVHVVLETAVGAMLVFVAGGGWLFYNFFMDSPPPATYRPLADVLAEQIRDDESKFATVKSLALHLVTYRLPTSVHRVFITSESTDEVRAVLAELRTNEHTFLQKWLKQTDPCLIFFAAYIEANGLWYCIPE